MSMANVAPGDIFTGGGLPFVDAALKKTLARNQVPVAIIGAIPTAKNQFGDQETAFEIRVSVKAAKAAGDPELAGDYKLTLPYTDTRADQAGKVLAALAAGADSIGPVYLSQAKSRAGNTYWALGGEAGDGTVTDADFNATAAPGALEPDDDDWIPF
jgi:hypothetical protein